MRRYAIEKGTHAWVPFLEPHEPRNLAKLLWLVFDYIPSQVPREGSPEQVSKSPVQFTLPVLLPHRQSTHAGASVSKAHGPAQNAAPHDTVAP